MTRTGPDPVEYLSYNLDCEDARELAGWGYRGPGWYYWDETWAYAHGPFATEAVARQELRDYVEAL